MARSTKAAQALTTGEVTGCISYNLREVLNHYSGDDQRDKKWGFPFWQRDYAWTRDQEDGWERRILKGGTITGVLQIFFFPDGHVPRDLLFHKRSELR